MVFDGKVDENSGLDLNLGNHGGIAMAISLKDRAQGNRDRKQGQAKLGQEREVGETGTG